MSRALRKHARAVVAIVFLGVIAVGISSYILSNQRLLSAGLGAGRRHRLLRRRR